MAEMTAALHRPMFGESGYERNALDAYWTPEWCTKELLEQFSFRGRVWEPACGRGDICRVLSSYSYMVAATDIADHGHHDRLADFFKCSIVPRDVQSIVTNPPYSDAVRFIVHALQLTRPVDGQVAMLLRNEFDCAGTRSELFDTPFAAKLVLTKRPKWSDSDVASPRHNFAWFVWDWRHQGTAKIVYQRRTS